MRKRTIVTLSAVGFVVLIGSIAGISGSPTTTPTGVPTPFTLPTSEPKVTATPDPEPEPEVSEDTSVDTLDTAFDVVVGRSFQPDEIEPAKRVAKSFCGLLDTGMDFQSAATTTLGFANDNGVTANQLGVIIGAGVPAYCPEYRSDLDAFVAANQ